MLDLFSIFSKGGIVLWCFQSTSDIFSPSVNALIRSVILQERSGNNSFNHNSLTLQYKLDNEFELVFVVAYQRILQLSYVDKFLNDVHLEFRDKYKNELQSGRHMMDFDFRTCFDRVLKECEQWAKSQAKIPKQMRTFEDSQKSKKTVASMIERKGDEKGKKSVKIVESKNLMNGKEEETPEPEDDIIAANRAKLAQKIANKNKKENKKSPKSPKLVDRTKKPRVWELGGDFRDLPSLDFSTDKAEDADVANITDTKLIGQMTGAVRDLEVESEESSSEEEIESNAQPSPKKSGGMFSIFKGLVGSKALNEETMRPVLDKLRDHLIAKNVAADIANKLCDSVAAKLNGKTLGTFESVTGAVRGALREALVRILSPRRRVDVLRDALHAQQLGRPYVMAFCGVNGVGKSTNLAKICFWLTENGLSVLIAACDTFRAGAVEQLRTHARRLNALHQGSVHLYEKGYGKDAAGIAMEAIRYAAETKRDVVLIDTAGRMQDNEPLMRALAKLIKMLFVIATANESFWTLFMKILETISEDDPSKSLCVVAYATELGFNVLLVSAMHRNDVVLLRVFVYYSMAITIVAMLIYSMVIANMDVLNIIVMVMNIVYQVYEILLVRSAIVEIKETKTNGDLSKDLTTISIKPLPDVETQPEKKVEIFAKVGQKEENKVDGELKTEEKKQDQEKDKNEITTITATIAKEPIEVIKRKGKETKKKEGSVEAKEKKEEGEKSKEITKKEEAKKSFFFSRKESGKKKELKKEPDVKLETVDEVTKNI